MLDLFNIAKPQNCDIQTFYKDSTWLKPRGSSHTYMLLIGGGGNGNGSVGGGSGAVTVWYGASQNIPDSLIVIVSTGPATNSSVRGRFNSGSASGINLINTSSTDTTGGAGGAATAANQFAASGFYQSIAGQNGSTADQTASATTFLSGGNGPGGVGVITANYGYSRGPGSGFFQLQPIIVGVGGCNGGASKGGIGCGSDADAVGTATGGPGLVLIASW